MRIHSCSEGLCVSALLMLHHTSACSAWEQTADDPDNNAISCCCINCAKSPKKRKSSGITQVNVRKALSCRWDNASDGFAFVPDIAQVAQLAQWKPPPPPPSDPPSPRCSAWTMFSVQTHYRKCKQLTECHSQGYCLSPLLAVHLHWCWPSSETQSTAKKTQALAIFGPAPLHRQGISTEISKDLRCKWVAQISFFSPNDFLSRAPYYKSSASFCTVT